MVVTDVQARKQILINKTRYFNCLGVGHVIQNCTKPQKCYICQGKHHISICNSNIQNPKSNDSKTLQKTRRKFLLVTFYFLLVIRYILLVTRYFLLATCYFLLVTRYFYSLFITFYSLLVTFYSILDNFYSLM